MRINRSNPEPSGAQQPAVQPQTAAPAAAGTPPRGAASGAAEAKKRKA